MLKLKFRFNKNFQIFNIFINASYIKVQNGEIFIFIIT